MGHWSDNRWSPVESHRFLWVFEFDNQGKAVSQGLVRDAKESRREAYCSRSRTKRGCGSWPTPGADECLLFIWPDKEWDSDVSLITNDGGAPVIVDGAALWSTWRWLPFGAFAQMVLTAGKHAVSVKDLSKTEVNRRRSTRTFKRYWSGRLTGRASYQAASGSSPDAVPVAQTWPKIFPLERIAEFRGGITGNRIEIAARTDLNGAGRPERRS
jgi:hypothetical protein